MGSKGPNAYPHSPTRDQSQVLGPLDLGLWMEIFLLRVWMGGGAERNSTVGRGTPPWGTGQSSWCSFPPPLLPGASRTVVPTPALEGHGMAGVPLKVQLM